MENLLVKLMVIAALAELGMSAKTFSNCHSRQCFQEIKAASNKVLDIQWRPISMFPEEAKKFR